MLLADYRLDGPSAIGFDTSLMRPRMFHASTDHGRLEVDDVRNMYSEEAADDPCSLGSTIDEHRIYHTGIHGRLIRTADFELTMDADFRIEHRVLKTLTARIAPGVL